MSSRPAPRRRPPGRFRVLAPAALAAALLAAAAGSAAAELRVEVTALRSTRGTVHVALHDSPEAFPGNDGMVADRVVPATAPVAVFEDLAPGRYAVAVFHDENDNDEFDQGLFGIPLEGYAFSMGARAFFGPPNFDEADFEVDGTGTTVTIPMTYW